MRFEIRISVVFAILLSVTLLAGSFQTASSGEDSELEKNMKAIGKSMKAIKALVAKGEVAGVKENAELIAADVVKIKTLEPPINKDRKAEMGPLADKSAESAKALAAVTDAAELKAKFDALGMSCKKCHDIFQPEE